ncbi:MAG: hypothetical protein JXQ65_04515 [Candidatus Marinimicrobia bacterium]|nr:hypothetical protein [Candidatus Neomarinimicrobiota bacterium]
MKRTIIASILIILIQRCSIDFPGKSEMPNWDVELNFPLGTKTFFARDMMKASTVTTYISQEGDSIIAFANDALGMERTVVGDSLKIDNITESYTQSIEDVTVENIDEKVIMDMSVVSIAPFDDDWSDNVGPATVRDNLPKGSTPAKLKELFDFTPYGNGAEVTIPQNTEYPSIYRPVDFDEFDKVVIKEGFMDVRILNDLIVELGSPIIITFCNPDSTEIMNDKGVVLTTTYNGSLQPGETSPVFPIPLSNHPLENLILARVEGVICGFGSRTVMNNSENINSSFNMFVSTRDIVVRSAIAIVPEQNFDTTSTVAMPESEHEIISATVKSGNLKINLNNRLNVESLVNINIPGLTQSGVIFNETLTIPPISGINKILSLDDYKITPENDSILVYSFVKTLTTDPNKVYIDEFQGIDLEVFFFGTSEGDSIIFKEFEGIVDQDDIEKEGEIDIDSDTRITSATISRGTIELNLDNKVIQEIDADMTLTLVIPDIVDESNNPIAIGPLTVSPGMTPLFINADNSLAGYKLRPQQRADKEQYVTYDAEIIVPRDTYGIYDLEESFITDIKITGLRFSSVTGYFNEEAIVKEDSTSFPGNNKLDLADFKDGILNIHTENHFGLYADVSFVIPEFMNKQTGEPLELLINMNPEEMEYNQQIGLQDYIFSNMKEREFLYYESKISIPTSEEMTLDASKNVNADIKIENIVLNSIKGHIDTIEVKIAEVEEKVADFPEELKDINLEETTLEVHFDTNIGIDFELDMEIISCNSEGDSEAVHVHHIIKKDDPATRIVTIDEANQLLNIAPDNFVFSGNIRLYGEGEIDQEQYLGGQINVLVPLIISVDADTKIELDPEKITTDLPDELVSVFIHSEIDNSFDLTGLVRTLISRDTTDFLPESSKKPDTLMVFRFVGNQIQEQQIEIIDDRMNMLKDSCYIKNEIELDATLPGEKIKVLTRDRLKLFMYGTIVGHIDLSDGEEK